jgi:hypothetical protein
LLRARIPQDMTETRKTVDETVWNWRNKSGENKTDHRKRILIAACVQVAIMLVICALFLKNKHPVPGYVLAGIAAYVLLTAFFIESAYEALDNFMRKKFAFWIGTCLTWMLLTPFFYICFTAGRIVQLMRGRDPMHRKWEKDMKTYWMDRKPVTDKQYFERQY